MQTKNIKLFWDKSGISQKGSDWKVRRTPPNTIGALPDQPTQRFVVPVSEDIVINN